MVGCQFDVVGRGTSDPLGPTYGMSLEARMLGMQPQNERTQGKGRATSIRRDLPLGGSDLEGSSSTLDEL